jgi:outer membrane receptor protein involved in Fe transport
MLIPSISGLIETEGKRSRHSRRFSLAAMMGCGVLAGLPAGAETAAVESAAGAPDTQIDTVIVTAGRLGSQDIQDIPMAVTALNPETLSKLNLTSLSDFTRLAPSVNMESTGNGINTITIRGLATRGSDSSETEDRSLVSVYLDDTPISLKSWTPDIKALDLESVEVLRGPQGTLYGAGAMAGNIRLITKKPDTENLSGYVEVEGSDTADFGGFNNAEKFAVNLPLIRDVLAVRINGYRDDMSGYIKNILIGGTENATRTDQGRVAVRWTPSDKLTVDATYTVDKVSSGLNYAEAGLPVYESARLKRSESNLDLNIFTLSLKYDMGFADLTSSSSFVRMSNYYLHDQSYEYYDYYFGNSGPLESADFDSGNLIHDFVQEIRMTSKTDGPLKWLGGLFYERQTRRFIMNNPYTNFDELYGAEVGIPDYSSVTNDLANQPNNAYYGLIHTVDRQFAAYGQVSYDLTSRLELTAGLRFFDWHEDYSIYSAGYVGDGPSASPESPIGTPLIVNSNPKATGVTPRFAASYKLTDTTNLYAEIAEGFRYGGVNQPVPVIYCGADLAAEGLTAAPASFGPDKLWSYTIGEKSKLADDRVTLNVAGFWINWKNTQTTVPLDCSYVYTQNIGSVTSKGVELETAAKLSRYATVSFNGSYNHSSAASDITNLHAPAGTTSPYAPRFIGSVTGSYHIPVAGNSLEFNANYSYKSSFNNSFNQSASSYRQIPSTKTLNGAVAYAVGRFEISVFGNNLANARNIEHIGAVPAASLAPGDDVAYDRPRTIGLRLRASF